MKAVTALHVGNVAAGRTHEKILATMWRCFFKAARGAAETIVEAAIVILIAAICIIAALRVHESCETGSCFNEAIANTVLTMENVH